ncbi:MAG TPA: transcriptional repressor LexA [Eubacteriales bacterium]|nr:transcriptional repressor LexA [Eubacteriales bacterium]
MNKIDNKLSEVYEYLKNYIDENSFPPTVREISTALGITSTSTVFYYLEKLQSQGKILRSDNKNRAITLVDNDNSHITSVPLVGSVCAGDGILAIENIEGYYSLPSEICKDNNVFLLKVKGDSMLGAGINENDVLIVRKQNTAENGKIVVALIDDIATVKRLVIEKNGAYLHPENDLYEDIKFNRVSQINIQGVVVGSYRKF